MGLQLTIGGPGANKESNALAGLAEAYETPVTLGQAEEIIIRMIRMTRRRQHNWVTRFNAVGPEANGGLVIYCDHWCPGAWPVASADDMAHEMHWATPGGYIYYFHAPEGKSSRRTRRELDELWELVHMASQTYPDMCSASVIERYKPFTFA